MSEIQKQNQATIFLMFLRGIMLRYKVIPVLSKGFQQFNLATSN